MARDDDPRHIGAVRVRRGEICGGPRRLRAGKDGGRARVEVEDDKVDGEDPSLLEVRARARAPSNATSVASEAVGWITPAPGPGDAVRY